MPSRTVSRVGATTLSPSPSRASGTLRISKRASSKIGSSVGNALGIEFGDAVLPIRIDADLEGAVIGEDRTGEYASHYGKHGLRTVLAVADPDHLVGGGAVQLLAVHRGLHVVEQVQTNGGRIKGRRVEPSLAHALALAHPVGWPRRMPVGAIRGQGRPVRLHGAVRRRGPGRQQEGGRVVWTWRLARSGEACCPGLCTGRSNISLSCFQRFTKFAWDQPLQSPSK